MDGIYIIAGILLVSLVGMACIVVDIIQEIKATIPNVSIVTQESKQENEKEVLQLSDTWLNKEYDYDMIVDEEFEEQPL